MIADKEQRMIHVTDKNHPLYVPEENRQIARDRAKTYVEKIIDYLEVKDGIPTGFNQSEQIEKNKQRILDILG
jgi:hypothetical protein